MRRGHTPPSGCSGPSTALLSASCLRRPRPAGSEIVVGSDNGTRRRPPDVPRGTAEPADLAMADPTPTERMTESNIRGDKGGLSDHLRRGDTDGPHPDGDILDRTGRRALVRFLHAGETATLQPAGRHRSRERDGRVDRCRPVEDRETESDRQPGRRSGGLKVRRRPPPVRSPSSRAGGGSRLLPRCPGLDRQLRSRDGTRPALTLPCPHIQASLRAGAAPSLQEPLCRVRLPARLRPT